MLPELSAKEASACTLLSRAFTLESTDSEPYPSPKRSMVYCLMALRRGANVSLSSDSWMLGVVNWMFEISRASKSSDANEVPNQSFYDLSETPSGISAPWERVRRYALKIKGLVGACANDSREVSDVRRKGNRSSMVGSTSCTFSADKRVHVLASASEEHKEVGKFRGPSSRLTALSFAS